MGEASLNEALKNYDAARLRRACGVNPVNELSPFVGTVGVGTSDMLEDVTEDTAISAPAFPLEVLPPILQRFIQETADSLPVPVDLIAAPVLACLGAAIGAHRVIELKPNWTATAALYVACVADPGSLKTPALSLAASPVYQQQQRYEQTYQDALTEYQAAEAGYLRDMEAYKKNKTNSIPEKPVEPVRQRTWTADVTTERLAGLLKENPHGMIIIRDEISAWIKSFNQYKGGKGSDKQFYLSAWSGEPLAVDRQGKDPLLIQHPFLSVVGCIPPDVLPDLDEDCREDGFLHRLLFVYPDSVPVRWTEVAISDTAKQGYHELIGKLYGLQPNLDGSPVVLRFSRKAKELFVKWHDMHCTEQEDLTLPGLVRGAYSKLKGYGARLALIHALASNPNAQEVDVESVGAAADLTDYFKKQVQRVAPLLGASARTPEGRCKQSLQRLFSNGKRLTKREAQRAGNAEAKVFNTVWNAWIQEKRLVPDTTNNHRHVFYMRPAESAAVKL